MPTLALPGCSFYTHDIAKMPAFRAACRGHTVWTGLTLGFLSTDFGCRYGEPAQRIRSIPIQPGGT